MSRSLRTARALALLASTLCSGACNDDIPLEERTYTRDELLDPETCRPCHEKHYREWSVSMHAYAADDPVFIAMNQRGQDETRGGDHPLGDFCVNCHAPMAVREGATTDGTNLVSVPQHLKGVTCYFCHNAIGVGEHANGDIELADDTTMRGGFGRGTDTDPSPLQPPAHNAEYSPLHDRERIESSQLCGACHDVVTPEPHRVHLERTFAEYQASLYARPDQGFQACSTCHMRKEDEPAPVARFPGARARDLHEHLWPGVDVATTDFPDAEGRAALRAAVEECALLNDSIQYTPAAINTETGELRLEITLETSAGHKMPSGAAQDRRMWLELVMYDAGGNVLFESGTIGDDELEEHPPGDAQHDPHLWLMRDRMLAEDAAGEPVEVHMFWQATSFDDVSNRSLPVPKPPPSYHWDSRTYPLANIPARATVRVRMRPIGLDVLRDLVDSGYLDPTLLAEMPTFTVLERELVWHSSEPFDFEDRRVAYADCDRYKCLLDPSSSHCDR